MDELTFPQFAEIATGCVPYDYQRRIAEEGLPELLWVPTGSGKTAAAVLPWLYRRRLHPEAEVRVATPHWLVFVLPMRVLVEQTSRVIEEWLARLSDAGVFDDIHVNVVMGGEGRKASEWRLRPEDDAIFVGTVDMFLSRALNRGYGESRFSWPIDFGLFQNGCQWVFDEVQLLGPGLPTSRQLEGLRRTLGTAVPSASMWMSATVDEEALQTVDLPEIGKRIELEDTDRSGPLGKRLAATKQIEELEITSKTYEKEVAAAIADRHRPGTFTLAVFNTVRRASDVFSSLAKVTDAPCVLLHSRFRPGDRMRRVEEALALARPDRGGGIVVSTQVVEAGVDISATMLFTEAAPWPSIVQRAGRCNRDGDAIDARLLWAQPPKPGPYLLGDVAATAKMLTILEGREVTSPELGATTVEVEPTIHPVLRRRDLIGLFDTTPDLSGNDLDVSRFIRTTDDLDVLVAWRMLDEKQAPLETPTRDELCPVPVGEMRDFAKTKIVWCYDHLDAVWKRARGTDIRPGATFVVRAADGGYSAERGWNAKSTAAVVPVDADDTPFPIVAACEAVVDDAASVNTDRWVHLAQHLADAEKETRLLTRSIDAPGLSSAHLDAAIVAARLHDIGKAHEVFQHTMLATCSDCEEPPASEPAEPWAKSGGTKRAVHERRYFRHELASALALLAEGESALEGVQEPDLAVYLVASHHGRVRLGIRALPDEAINDVIEGGKVALGIFDGEVLPEVVVPGGTVPSSTLSLSVMGLGDHDGKPSWSRRALALRDREDLGVFRLAFLEALVRLADWRASASPGGA